MYKFPRIEVNWNNHRKFQDFLLGFAIGRNKVDMLAPDESYETLNTNKELKTIGIKKYYIIIDLGYWQFSIELVTR